MTALDHQWHSVLTHSDEEIRRIASYAARDPSLRRLYPYASMRNLRFREPIEPFRERPYILVHTPGERYQLRDARHAPLFAGSLEEVIAALVHVISLDDKPFEPSPLVGTVVPAIVMSIENFGLVAQMAVGSEPRPLYVSVTDTPPTPADLRDHFRIGQRILVNIQRRTVLGDYAGSLVRKEP